VGIFEATAEQVKNLKRRIGNDIEETIFCGNEQINADHFVYAMNKSGFNLLLEKLPSIPRVVGREFFRNILIEFYYPEGTFNVFILSVPSYILRNNIYFLSGRFDVANCPLLRWYAGVAKSLIFNFHLKEDEYMTSEVYEPLDGVVKSPPLFLLYDAKGLHLDVLKPANTDFDIKKHSCQLGNPYFSHSS